jgi:lysozyme family protein
MAIALNTVLLNAQSALNTSAIKDLRQANPENLTFYVTFATGSTAGVVKLYALAKATDTSGSGQQIGNDFDLSALTAAQTYTLELPARSFNAVEAKITTAVTGGAAPSVTVRLSGN